MKISVAFLFLLSVALLSKNLESKPAKSNKCLKSTQTYPMCVVRPQNDEENSEGQNSEVQDGQESENSANESENNEDTSNDDNNNSNAGSVDNEQHSNDDDSNDDDSEQQSNDNSNDDDTNNNDSEQQSNDNSNDDDSNDNDSGSEQDNGDEDNSGNDVNEHDTEQDSGDDSEQTDIPGSEANSAEECQLWQQLDNTVSKSLGNVMFDVNSKADCERRCLEMNPKNCIGFELYDFEDIACFAIPDNAEARETSTQMGATLFILDKSCLEPCNSEEQDGGNNYPCNNYETEVENIEESEGQEDLEHVSVEEIQEELPVENEPEEETQEECHVWEEFENTLSKSLGQLMEGARSVSECQNRCLEMDPENCVGFDFYDLLETYCYALPDEKKTYRTTRVEGMSLFLLDRSCIEEQ